MRLLITRHNLFRFKSCGTSTVIFSVLLLWVGFSSLSHAQITSLENLQILMTRTDEASKPSAPNKVQNQPVSTNPNVFYAAPGVWGRLRCAYIYLEAPKQLIENYPLPSTTPRWAFPEALRNDLPSLFQKAGLPESVSQSLLDPKSLLSAEGMIYVFPKGPEI